MAARDQRSTPPDILGPLAKRIMEYLWRVGSATVSEAREALMVSDERGLAYTTVLTVLVRLHQKGFVTRSREGRQFRYAPAFDEAELGIEIGRREFQRLIDRHGIKSVAGFARDLVEADTALLDRLRELAERASGDES